MDTKPIVDKNNVTWTVRLEESIGNYGVLVLHDKDLNGKMKTNAVGKPKAVSYTHLTLPTKA